MVIMNSYLPFLSICLPLPNLPTYLPSYLPIFVITQQQQQQVPVGPGTLGRILNVIGEPVDEQGPIEGMVYHIMMMLVM
jgi:hypothetical protein